METDEKGWVFVQTKQVKQTVQVSRTDPVQEISVKPDQEIKVNF